MLKMRLLALATVLIPSPTAPEPLPVSVVDPSAIVQIICVSQEGDVTAGTAFRVGRSLMLSVNHVVSGGQCFINRVPVHVKYTSSDSDFSMLDSGPGPFLKVDCGGFHDGHKYLAIGYARGLPQETVVELTATGQSANGFAILTGIFTVVPGMSGGPIVDEETGRVVGTVNVFVEPEGLSGSVELRGTPVCKGRIA